MWIVRLALRRPYTFVVMSMMIVILGVLATFRMPTDIFPEIDIPVVSVIWSYGGISPEEMAEVVTIRCERSFTTSVNDIEHMESQSLPGLSIIKIFFHPNAKVEAAVAQLAAASQAVLHSLPTGMTPPSILRYNASSVPILQLSISSDTMSESSLYDYGYNFIRTQMATVQGASFPLPYGGRPARSWSISTSRRSTRKGSRPTTWSAPSIRKASSSPPASPKSVPTNSWCASIACRPRPKPSTACRSNRPT